MALLTWLGFFIVSFHSGFCGHFGAHDGVFTTRQWASTLSVEAVVLVKRSLSFPVNLRRLPTPAAPETYGRATRNWHLRALVATQQLLSKAQTSCREVRALHRESTLCASSRVLIGRSGPGRIRQIGLIDGKLCRNRWIRLELTYLDHLPTSQKRLVGG